MNLDNDQKELLELFVTQEFRIGALYKLFAKRYPEHNAFWTEMATEEFQHAALIKRIAESDTQNMFTFSQGELRAQSLASSLEYIESIINGFKSDKNFSINQAVRVSLQIEKGLWERKVFQCFAGDSEDVKKIMESLDSEQGIHIQKLDNFGFQFLDKNRKAAS
ncbi:MAG: hypothetical protein PHI31_04500 [Desulfuromonadaceae bacterium]|nr:hypothetical protein [Desulfuromonadaceae bacterium]